MGSPKLCEKVRKNDWLCGKRLKVRICAGGAAANSAIPHPPHLNVASGHRIYLKRYFITSK